MTLKTALVTVGGRGIGPAISRLLAARGANIIVNYLSNKESGESSLGNQGKQSFSS